MRPASTQGVLPGGIVLDVLALLLTIFGIRVNWAARLRQDREREQGERLASLLAWRKRLSRTNGRV